MILLQKIPYFYLLCALLISLYQGYRGFTLQLLLGVRNSSDGTELGKKTRVFLLCFADMFTYFICALTSSFALCLLYCLAMFPDLFPEFRIFENSLLLIFLLLYGILGITGKLPELLHKISLQ